MRACELPVKIPLEGTIRMPDDLVDLLPRDQTVRLIIRVDDTEARESAEWSRLTAEQFLASEDPADAICDNRRLG